MTVINSVYAVLYDGDFTQFCRCDVGGLVTTAWEKII